MKKVKMILTNSFIPDVRVYKEAKYLVERGLDVEVLCWDREGDFTHAEIEQVDGIRIKRFFPFSRYGTGYKQIVPYIKFIMQLGKYLRDKEYQYLHCHDLDGIIAGWLLRKKGAKLIFDMHEFYEVNRRQFERVKYLVRGVVGFFQNNSDHIIFVNEVQTVPIAEKNQHKLVYLPNYPETSAYSNCEKETSDKLRISYIGAVRQFKQLKNLFDACRDMEDVSTYIHGSGVAYHALSEIAPEYPNVTLTGRYHFSESARLYSETDLLYAVYPTESTQNRTAYPVKFFEAIITKTPIVVGENTVLADFVRKHGTGFVVNGNDICNIRQVIDEIRINQELLGKKTKNIKGIQFNYSWEHVVRNLDAIYGLNELNR